MSSSDEVLIEDTARKLIHVYCYEIARYKIIANDEMELFTVLQGDDFSKFNEDIRTLAENKLLGFHLDSEGNSCYMGYRFTMFKRQ